MSIGFLCGSQEHLICNYGDKALKIIDIKKPHPYARIALGYPYIEEEVIYAARYEYALSPIDFLARRIPLAFLDTKAYLIALPLVTKLLAEEFKWDSTKNSQEISKAIDFISKQGFNIK